MAIFAAAASLGQRIHELVQQRQTHADAIAKIDGILAEVSAALGNGAAKEYRAPLKDSANEATPTNTPRGPRRRRRGRFAISGDESILTFVREHRKPTTQDVNKHWKGEGRGGTADNALTKLVKERKLKRFPLEGRRGSSYELS